MPQGGHCLPEAFCPPTEWEDLFVAGKTRVCALGSRPLAVLGARSLTALPRDTTS